MMADKSSIKGSNNHIKVCCRIRPVHGIDESESVQICSTDPRGISPSEISVKLTNDNSNNGLVTIKFYVDDAFDCRHTQSDVFDRLVRPLVGDFFAGFHCVIFSYGQTGSGKTHTLIGGSSTEIAVPESEKGILPRAAELIFQRKKALLERNESGGTSCTVRLSVLEIYQERLKDLLLLGGGGQKQADAPLLRLREQSDGAVWVEGLTEVVLAEEQDFNRWVSAAMKKRVVGAHNMNSVSSRSHLCIVVSLSILQREGATAEGAGTAADRAGEKRISSKLHLVDLAGSEMVRKTDATGLRFDEAKHINKSLSALGNVISALSGNNSGGVTNQTKPHIPYRDSKLTRLLQNSLSGNAKTLIILAVSAAREHIQESISTLKFGERARQIKINPTANIQKSTDQQDLMKALADARREIAELKKTIADLQTSSLSGTNTEAEPNNTEFASLGPVAPGSGSICEICAQFIREIMPSAPAVAQVPYFPSPAEERSVQLQAKGKEQQQNGRTAEFYDDDNDEGDKEDEKDRQKREEEEEDSIESDRVDDIEGAAGQESCQRCALCRMDADEADQLQMDTGEYLGELFFCDGNCGEMFHVRCAGLVGDAGQFCLPDGEWFCVQCTSAAATIDEQIISVEGSDINEAVAASAMPRVEPQYPPEIRGDEGISSVQPSSSVIGEDETGKADAAPKTTGPIGSLPTDPPPTAFLQVLASVKHEYHCMRRERNRVLAMWQHEKKMQGVLEQHRAKRQQQADQEVIALRQTLDGVRDQQRTAEAESDRLRAMLDDALRQFQQQMASERESAAAAAAESPSSGWDGARRLSTSHQSWRSLLLTDEDNSSVQTRAVKTTVEKGAIDTKKPKDSSGVVDPSQSHKHIRFALVMAEPAKSSEGQAGNASTTLSSASSTTVLSKKASGATKRSLSEKSTDSEAAEKEELLVEGPHAAASPSKFINPLRNRLKDLLKTVEAETGSFAEIREKYHSKDRERASRDRDRDKERDKSNNNILNSNSTTNTVISNNISSSSGSVRKQQRTKPPQQAGRRIDADDFMSTKYRKTTHFKRTSR